MNKIEFKNFADLTRSEKVFDLIKETIERANAKLSSPEQIKKFVILERDFSPEMDEVTPTLKLKRNIVADNFAGVLQNLYDSREI